MSFGVTLALMLMGGRWLSHRPMDELIGFVRRFSQLTIAIVGVEMVSCSQFAEGADNAAHCGLGAGFSSAAWAFWL